MLAALKSANLQLARRQMTPHHPRSRPGIEIPIERIFRRIMKRKMTKAERRCFHLGAVPRTRVRS
jgi:hypothetical protein